jgi:hypothetical protein
MALLAITAQSPACVPPRSEPKYDAVPGHYKVIPARDAVQRRLLKLVDGNGLVRLTRSQAIAATGDKTLHARHYYLARAGYVAEPRLTATVPRGLALSINVDRNGVGYVTSYILSRQVGTAAIAVVVTSEKSIRRVVAVCGAAE